MNFTKRCVLVIFILFESWTSSNNAEENQKRRHEVHHHHRHKDARWDRWTPWTECSSECGTGISERSRLCRSVTNGLTVDSCIGVAHQIKVCEITGCIKADEHSEGCKELDDIYYGGRRYRWEPYNHPIKKCELACRPVGHGFYQGLGRNATNGTSCSSDGSRICLNGLCKTVGCDKIVDSNSTVDRCGICGGDGSSCRMVTKTFRDSAKFGYRTVGTIPAGARKITVSEVKESRNYLALNATDGSFHLNTDWRLNRFGEHPGAGTLFKYSRSKGSKCPGECITADGPTDVAVEVIGLFYTDNTGIKYSYSIPTNGSEIVIDDNDSEEGFEGPIFSYDFTFKKKNGHKRPGHHKHHKHSGTDRHDKNRDELRETKDFGSRTQTEKISEDNEDKVDINSEQNNIDISSAEINKTDINTTKGSIGLGEIRASGNNNEPGISEEDFGGGVYLNEAMAKESGETTKEESNSDTDKETVSDDMYTNDNRIPSLYSWRVNGFSECSISCGEGKQSPIVECIVIDKEIAVAHQYCSELTKPSTQVRACNYGPCPPSWRPRPWSKCSVTCGSGTQRRDYVCTRSDDVEVSSVECSSAQPRSEERSCDVGSCNMGWYFTDWPETCPVSCGEGVMSRMIYCFSGSGNADTACPQRSKPDTEKRCRGDNCGANWYTGPWSECNSTCGMAYQSRAVVCLLRQSRERTTVVGDNYCTGEEKPSTFMSCDLEPCGPQWYMNDWGRCSATCGSGQKSREVKCLDNNKRTSSGCARELKPTERESCEERKCSPSDSRRPNPPDSDCKDKFSSCHMVLQARLCQYKYYTNICCESCSKIKN